MSSFKRSQAKYVKQTHKIANWPAYDQALVARGSLTFWFTDEASVSGPPHQAGKLVDSASTRTWQSRPRWRFAWCFISRGDRPRAACSRW